MEGVNISGIYPADLNDPRGMTYEWCKGILGLQLTVFERKKGTVFGGHYHKGLDPSKNPERLFLIKGQLKLLAHNGMIDSSLEETVNEGEELLIFPGIIHSFHSLTDIIILEYRSTIFDRNNSDTFSPETYQTYIDSMKKL
ncbi:MAG: hypothetical protein AABW63_01305 [Nanoarchaeota archaeon]